MNPIIEVVEATPADASAIAEIHLTAREAAMPYLAKPFTDDKTRSWFADAVGDRPSIWWVAKLADQVIGYMLIDGECLDHLYVLPEAQGCGIGSALLEKARSLSAQRIALVTFQRNERARAFYEKHGFRAVRFTDDENVEGEPDVHYLWKAPLALTKAV